MRLIGHGFAFGLGYTLASPGGRRRLASLRERARALAQRPDGQGGTRTGRDVVETQGRAAADMRAALAGEHGSLDVAAVPPAPA